jgi:hypothetical protein
LWIYLWNKKRITIRHTSATQSYVHPLHLTSPFSLLTFYYSCRLFFAAILTTATPNNMPQTINVINVAATMVQQNFSLSRLRLASVCTWLSHTSQCVCGSGLGRRKLVMVWARVSGCKAEDEGGEVEDVWLWPWASAWSSMSGSSVWGMVAYLRLED